MRRATLIGGACFAAVAAFATTAHFRTATDTADTTTGAGPRTAEASRGGAQEGDGPESGRGEGRPLRPAQRTEESKALASAEDGVVSANAEIAQSLRDEGTCDERAVGLESDRGVLREGMRADLAMFRIRDPRELLYQLGSSPCSGLVKNGRYFRVESARPGRMRFGSH